MLRRNFSVKKSLSRSTTGQEKKTPSKEGNRGEPFRGELEVEMKAQEEGQKTEERLTLSKRKVEKEKGRGTT